MSLALLPIELLDNIGEQICHHRDQYFSQVTLARAALTNRTLYRLINPKLYRSIGESALRSLYFYRTITTRSDLGRVVTKAQWDPDADHRLHVELAFEILMLCPLLEHLVINLDSMVAFDDDDDQFAESHVFDTSELPFIKTLVTLELLAEGRHIHTWDHFWRLCVTTPSLKRIVLAAELYRTEWSVPAFADNQATATSTQAQGLFADIQNNTELRLTNFHCGVSTEIGVGVPQELSQLNWIIPCFRMDISAGATLDDYQEQVSLIPPTTSLRLTMGHANGNFFRMTHLEYFGQSLSASPTAGHLRQLSFPLRLLWPEDAGQWSPFLSRPALRRLERISINLTLLSFEPHTVYTTFYDIVSRRTELLAASEQCPNKTLDLVTELVNHRFPESDACKILVMTFQDGAMETTPCTVPDRRQGRGNPREMQALLFNYLRDPSSEAVRAARQGKPGERICLRTS